MSLKFVEAKNKLTEVENLWDVWRDEKLPA